MKEKGINDIELFELVIDNLYGVFLDCIEGFKKNYNHLLKHQKETIEKFKVSNPTHANINYLDSTLFIYGIGNPNNPNTKELHKTTQKTVKERNSFGGLNQILIGNYLLVAIYQYWEDYFRGKIARLLKVEKNKLTYNIFGDINALRKSIIHHNGLAVKEVENNLILTWFKKDDQIYIDDKKFEIIIDEIKKVVKDFRVRMNSDRNCVETSISDDIIKCKKCFKFGIEYITERKENLEYAYHYKPEKIKVLWIVESPPYIRPNEKLRYFYRPELSSRDGLFREVMKALSITPSNPKNKSLEEFMKRGHFLIDAAKCPVDKDNSHLKSQILKNCSDILAHEIIELNPDRIIIIKANIYDNVSSIIKHIGLGDRVLNNNLIPFPGSGQQQRFREAVTKYLKHNNSESFKLNGVNINQEIPEKSLTSTGIPFIIDNITEKDIKQKIIRILVENKSHFPRELRGEPKTYHLKIFFRNNEYEANYTIGSKDCKSRSGILKIDSNLYMNELKIRVGLAIRMTYLANNKYMIEKL